MRSQGKLLPPNWRGRQEDTENHNLTEQKFPCARVGKPELQSGSPNYKVQLQFWTTENTLPNRWIAWGSVWTSLRVRNSRGAQSLAGRGNNLWASPPGDLPRPHSEYQRKKSHRASGKGRRKRTSFKYTRHSVLLNKVCSQEELSY